MDARETPPENVHVDCGLSESIGLTLGRKIGLLDPTTQPTTGDRFDNGEWDELHRRLTVVDSYSAAVDLEELQRGRVDVVIQALGAEEMLLCLPPEDDEGLPLPGLKVWKHIFEGADLVERVSQVIDEHLRFVRAYDECIGLALDEGDARRLVDQGKVAMVLMLVSGLISVDQHPRRLVPVRRPDLPAAEPPHHIVGERRRSK